MKLNPSRAGVWLIGAYGDIATTLITGKIAIQEGLASSAGLATEMSPMNLLNICALDELIIGGHDIFSSTVKEQAEAVCDRSRTFSYPLLKQIEQQLEKIGQDIEVLPELNWEFTQPGEYLPSLVELCNKFRHLLKVFASKHNLDHIVVVNIASAETFIPLTAAHENIDEFVKLIDRDRKDQVSPSMLYAYAAFMENYSYLNFTPNVGASIGALQVLAVENGVPFYGNDGKTGETLVKTALAPMFAARHLKVMSWEGTNLLGNGDGKTLSEPENCKNKIQNKAAALPQILGYPVHAGVDINYVPSLGDWKTAWDLIHFKGFLDVPMTMQFTWQGCDSILAAPLVLDMVRLMEFAHRQGEHGPMHHLACFFKNPIGVGEHNFHKQYEMLIDYAAKHLTQSQ
ncbi:MAG: inositol-3-phosphate synthase [Methylomonas sp.]|jgi:myo-inositol-1-phosphate synthase|uniref:inositol-3-phosphate synthase n=1 Tax=Methylomonas sp. TaxID=418 RepID=UPI0025CD3AFB|nr:inositol-3-phosphate synthase [Methylomonas sp.]MCK9607058.1 inositol-3-phosphate synthase [Methylomonas sp.]